VVAQGHRNRGDACSRSSRDLAEGDGGALWHLTIQYLLFADGKPLVFLALQVFD
jgi:hypothetical protein